MHFEVGKKLPIHPQLEKIHRSQKFWNISYNVDADYVEGVDTKGKPIIKKFGCEKPKPYKERKENTSPRNLIGNIINSYVSVVFRNDQERDERLDDVFKDVDGRGSSMDTIMRRATLDTMINGYSPIILESDQEGTKMSLAQSRDEGDSDRIIVAPTKSLLNWFDVDGFLLTALIAFVDEEGNTFARYYTRDSIMDIEFNPKSWLISSVGDPVAHGFADIPVQLMRIDIAYESFVAPLAESQKSIANLLSELNLEIKENTFTRFFFDGISSESLKQIGLQWNTDRIMSCEISENGKSVGVHKLTSDTSQADSIRKSIEDEEQNLFRTAGMSFDDVGANSSGAARLLARDQFFVMANLITMSVEKTENYFIHLLSVSRNTTFESTFYSRSFLEPQWQDEINQLRDILQLEVAQDIKDNAINMFRQKFGL